MCADAESVRDIASVCVDIRGVCDIVLVLSVTLPLCVLHLYEANVCGITVS